MKAEEFAQLAIQYVGCPAIKYRREELGKDKNGFDCSGLIWCLLKQINFPGRFPRHCNAFFDWFGITIHKPEAGDLVFFSYRTKGRMPDHMGVMIDKRHYVHSPGKDGRVVNVLSLCQRKIKGGVDGQIYFKNPIGFKRLAVQDGRYRRLFFD